MSAGKVIVLLTPTLKQYRVRRFGKFIGSEYLDIVQLRFFTAVMFKVVILTVVSLEVIIV